MSKAKEMNRTCFFQSICPKTVFFKFWHSGDLWIKRCSSKPWPKTLTWVWPMLLALEVWCNPIGIDTSNHGYFDGDKGWLSHQHDPRIDFKLLWTTFKGRRRYKYHKYTVTTVTIDRPCSDEVQYLCKAAPSMEADVINAMLPCTAEDGGNGWQRKGNRNTRRPSDVHQMSIRRPFEVCVKSLSLCQLVNS